MSDDLVARLNRENLYHANGEVADITEEAAAEIERLREANKWLEAMRLSIIPALTERAEHAEAERDALLDAICGLGVIGGGYCFCSSNRNPEKENHEPECQDLRVSIDLALDGKRETRPCPNCPDGQIWEGCNPTGIRCPVCHGHAEIYLDGSPIDAARGKHGG